MRIRHPWLRASHVRRVAIGAVVALLAALLVGVGVRPAAAGTDDYPSPWRAPTAADTMVDNWSEYNRECTSFAAFRLHSRNGFEMPFHDNAGGWGADASSRGYAVNMTPGLGSIAWWSSGHVAWVESISGSNVTIEEYNFNFTHNYSERTIAANSVSGYIHFNDLVTAPPPPGGSRRGDFNGDGKDDIAWHQGSSTLFMLNSTGNGFGVAGSNGGISVPDWAAGGNIDGAGVSEVYWYHSQTRTIYVLRWGGGTWNIISTTYGFDMPDHAVVGDFNGDGRDDIAWHQDTTLFLLASNGSGFDVAGRNPLDAPIGVPDWAGAGNIDGVGPSEVYWHDASQNIYAFRWNGSTWSGVAVSGGFGTPNAAVVGDFNGDGKDDIAWHQGPSTLFMLNSTGGGFGVAGSSGAISTPDFAAAGNNDGSGPSEVYWYHSQTRTIYVLRWGGGTWNIVSTSGGFDMPDHMVSAG